MSHLPFRQEWRKFSQDKQDFLRRLVAAPPPPEAPATTSGIAEAMATLVRADDEFLTQCLVTCCLREPWNPARFALLLGQVQLVAAEGGVAATDKDAFWERTFRELLCEAVEAQKPDILWDLLDQAHCSSQPRVRGRPGSNHPALLAACEKDDYELVRPLLSFGYRLRLSYLSSDSRGARIARGETSWWDLVKLPFLTGGEEESRPLKEDHLEFLQVLSMMSRPTYILGCYGVVAELKDLKGCYGSVCECWMDLEYEREGLRCRTRTSDHDGSHSVVGLSDLMSLEVTAEEHFHHCPGSKRFRPSADCLHHLECNDPIYRCFNLSTIASRACGLFPQYREELERVEASCRRLSAELVDLCRDEEEVTALMAEKAASSKYFGGQTGLVHYPRLRFAVERGHHEFVSRVPCQFFLSRKWYGDTHFEGEVAPYKVAYFVLEVLLTPVHTIVAMFAWLGRHVKQANRDYLPPVSSADSRLRKAFLRYRVARFRKLLYEPTNPIVVHMLGSSSLRTLKKL